MSDEAELRAVERERDDLLSEVDRLNSCLRYEENRATHIGSHGPGCWAWGPGHFECALEHIEALNADLAAEARGRKDAAWRETSLQRDLDSRTTELEEQRRIIAALRQHTAELLRRIEDGAKT